MNFYANRTVEEQASRLPLEIRQKYKETQLDRIEIDGVQIQGYFEYSFLEEKSYREQPIRSDDGSIQDLENYATFLTPRLIIRYNMMHIEDYRKLMKLLKSKNVFKVVCYDIVEDKRVLNEMYFAPPQMPIIYQQYLMALGIQEYTIELIGTNRKTSFNIKYDFNLSGDNLEIFESKYGNEPQVQYMTGLAYNQKHKIGNIYLSDGESLSNMLSGFEGWGLQKNDNNFVYKDGVEYFITKDLVLYAQWG